MKLKINKNQWFVLHNLRYWWFDICR